MLSDDNFKYKFQNIKTPVFYLPFKYLPKNNISFRIDKLFRFIYSLTFGIRLWIFLVKYNQKIIHSHIYTQLISQVLASLLSNKYIIWTIHGEYSLKNRTILFIRVIKYFISDNKFQIIADSIPALHSTLPFTGNNFNPENVIPTGIYLKPYLQEYDQSFIRKKYNIEDGTILIGSSGRIVWQKGYDQLLSLLENYDFNNKKLHFLIAGEGSLRKTLISGLKEKKLESYITFIGNINNIPEFLSALDIYIQPSVTEGFPLSVLEAMATGLPIICSDAGGLKELITDGETGLVYETGNVEELNVTLNKCLTMEKEELVRMGENARNKVINNNSIDQIAKSYHELYMDIINE